MTQQGQKSIKVKKLKKDPRRKVWADWQGAVLLKNEIRYYASLNPPLIDPFLDEKKFLKGASYHLRLGNRCRVNGEDCNLSDDNPVLRIPPHGIAVVRTLEKVNIPGFMIARWNLKVKKVYKGLVWVGSLQVDPGYSGYLFCPLYNLSNEEQRLEYKEALFTIDFVRTTKGCELWEADPSRATDSLGALDKDNLKSAPAEQFAKMRTDLDDMKSEISGLRRTILPVLAIIIAAVAITASLGFGKFILVGKLSWASIIISIVAISTAAVALFKNRIRR